METNRHRRLITRRPDRRAHLRCAAPSLARDSDSHDTHPPEHANNNMPGMHVGTQYFETDEKSMQFLQRFGVQHLDARVP
jgi:ribosomal protein L32